MGHLEDCDHSLFLRGLQCAPLLQEQAENMVKNATYAVYIVLDGWFRITAI